MNDNTVRPRTMTQVDDPATDPVVVFGDYACQQIQMYLVDLPVERRPSNICITLDGVQIDKRTAVIDRIKQRFHQFTYVEHGSRVFVYRN